MAGTLADYLFWYPAATVACMVFGTVRRRCRLTLSMTPRVESVRFQLAQSTVPFKAIHWFQICATCIPYSTYWLPKLIVTMLPTQNLKKKYGAEWAVVTGSSSGIGKAVQVEHIRLTPR